MKCCFGVSLYVISADEKILLRLILLVSSILSGVTKKKQKINKTNNNDREIGRYRNVFGECSRLYS